MPRAWQTSNCWPAKPTAHYVLTVCRHACQRAIYNLAVTLKKATARFSMIRRSPEGIAKKSVVENVSNIP